MKRLIFPGSFDPFTKAHMDLALRGQKLCDELLIVVAKHPEKKGLFSLEERASLILRACGHYDKMRVIVTEGLLIDVYQSEGAVAVLRGIRDAADLQYEERLGEANRFLDPNYEQILLESRPAYRGVRASLLRELTSFGIDASAFVPEASQSLFRELLAGKQGIDILRRGVGHHE